MPDCWVVGKRVWVALLQKISYGSKNPPTIAIQGGDRMSDFKWKHFQGEITLGCVRWYCIYGICYRDLED
jgi:hypothetical protein